MHRHGLTRPQNDPGLIPHRINMLTTYVMCTDDAFLWDNRAESNKPHIATYEPECGKLVKSSSSNTTSWRLLPTELISVIGHLVYRLLSCTLSGDSSAQCTYAVFVVRGLRQSRPHARRTVAYYSSQSLQSLADHLSHVHCSGKL
jgi:hypothetical protein